MNRSILRLSVALMALSACAAVETDATPALARPGAAGRTEMASVSSAVEASAPRASAEELAIWREPAFRRRLVESYVAVTEIEPSVTSVERERLIEIFDLISEDETEKAIARLQKYGGPAASAVFDYTLATLRLQREELDEASQALRAAVEKYPNFRRAWQQLGQLYVREGDFAAAVPVLTRVLEMGGGDGPTYGVLGFAYTNLQNPVSAESAYRMAVLLDPETDYWRRGLAVSFFEQRRFAEAAALFGTLIEQQPDNAELWLLQAKAFLGLDETLEAAGNLEMVDRLGHATPDELNLLGDIYTNEKLFDVAVDFYLRAMEADLERPPARAIRAAKELAQRFALKPMGRLVARIEEAYADRLDDAERVDLYRMRARLAVAEGADDEQARVLEEIVAIDPLDGEALILLGDHNRRLEDFALATFYYERAESLEDFEADAKVQHAQLLVDQGDYRAALPLLRRAQELKPRENVQQFLEDIEGLVQGR